jgi:hypothetical protein
LVLLVLAACGTGDDTADGTRALCAEGGAINDCDDAAHSAHAACWRMVDCGAIPVHHDEPFQLDWDRCVGEIEDMAPPQARLVIGCIGAATCDQLKVQDQDTGQRPCFLLGEN